MAELERTDYEVLAEHQQRLSGLDFTDCLMKHHKRFVPGETFEESRRHLCPEVDRRKRPHCPHAEVHT
ncbi:MAG TPA: hypothetical protein VIT68_01310 [Candidatus Gracilibacteria bacterium]